MDELISNIIIILFGVIMITLFLVALYLSHCELKPYGPKLDRIRYENVLVFKDTYWIMSAYIDKSVFNTNNVIIGCKQRTIREWNDFFNCNCNEIITNDRDSDTFKRIKKDYQFARKQALIFHKKHYPHEYH